MRDMIKIKLPDGTRLDPDILTALTVAVNAMVAVRQAQEYALRKKTLFFNPEKRSQAVVAEVSTMLNDLSPLQKAHAVFILMGWSRGEVKMVALKGDYTKEATMLVKGLLRLTGGNGQREVSLPELNKMYVEMGLDLVFTPQEPHI